MRHLKAGRKLGRNASHRLALMRNLSRALIQHERIVTTVEKAKELRPFVEKLITLAKKNTLHARRLVLARLGATAKPVFYDDEGQPTDDSALRKLFKEIGPRFADRPGGYTRIIKRPERRLGDAGKTAFIELLKEGDTRVQRRQPAPAPRVTAPEPAPTPPASTTPGAPPTPPPEQPTASTTEPTPPAGQTSPPAAPSGSETPPSTPNP